MSKARSVVYVILLSFYFIPKFECLLSRKIYEYVVCPRNVQTCTIFIEVNFISLHVIALNFEDFFSMLNIKPRVLFETKSRKIDTRGNLSKVWFSLLLSVQNIYFKVTKDRLFVVLTKKTKIKLSSYVYHIWGQCKGGGLTDNGWLLHYVLRKVCRLNYVYRLY